MCICGRSKLRNGIVLILAIGSVYGVIFYSLGRAKETAAPLAAFVVAGLVNVWCHWSKTTRYATYERATELCTYLGPRGGPRVQRIVDRYFQLQMGEGEFVAVAQADFDENSNDNGTNMDDSILPVAILIGSVELPETATKPETGDSKDKPNSEPETGSIV